MIVETDDPLRITKWEADHLGVKKYKVIPIFEDKMWYELMEERMSHVIK
jgi:hypothetical protein